MTKVSKELIEKVYRENFSNIHLEFNKIQSYFLIEIYKRYNHDLDKANIVLMFAKNLHQEILRQRDSDLDYDISFDSFWINHLKIRQKKLKLVNISSATKLPKETTRRKIQNLLKTKILKKSSTGIYWSPLESDKQTYNLIIEKHIEILTSLIRNLAEKIKIDFSIDFIKREIKKNFSFYWFHYLSAQSKYMSLWQKELKDLEMLLLCIECEVQASSIYKKNLVSVDNHYIFKKAKKNAFPIPSISATSISDVTGLPRATCIRKLEKLNKMKMLKKDNLSKRYLIDTDGFFNLKGTAEEVIKEFSEFYLVIIRGLIREKNKL